MLLFECQREKSEKKKKLPRYLDVHGIEIKSNAIQLNEGEKQKQHRYINNIITLHQSGYDCLTAIFFNRLSEAKKTLSEFAHTCNATLLLWLIE